MIKFLKVIGIIIVGFFSLVIILVIIGSNVDPENKAELKHASAEQKEQQKKSRGERKNICGGREHA